MSLDADAILSKLSLQEKREHFLVTGLFLLYTFLSYFEIYFQKFFGTNTKYLILLLVGLILCDEGLKIKLNVLSGCIIAWFLLKVLSLTWSDHSDAGIVQSNFLSQVGMMLLTIMLTSQTRSRYILNLALKMHYCCSFLFGVLSIFFHRPYIDEAFDSRQVLTLWGMQNDPNNVCAFLAVGVGLAAYSLFCEKRMRGMNILVILVNTYAVVLTGSRGGFLLLGVLIITAVLFPNWNNDRMWSDAFKKILIVIVAGVAAIIVIRRFMPQSSLARVLDFDNYFASGGSGRFEKWRIAWDYYSRHPLFGCGWGGYVIQDHRAIHNTYLTLLCDTGLVGFTLYIIPIAWIFIRGVQKKSLLSLIILVTGAFPALTVDSINKRYLWNAILISFMLIQYLNTLGDHIGIWSRQSSNSMEIIS